MAESKTSLPEELKEMTDEFPDVDWQAVIKKLPQGELERLLELKRIVSKSKLTEEDCLRLGRKVNEGMYREYKKRLDGLDEPG